MKRPSKGRTAHHTRWRKARQAAGSLRTLVAMVSEPAPPAPIPAGLLKQERKP